MDTRDLTGYWTYRSFLNTPQPVDDFNKVKFAEAELYLNAQPSGAVLGSLSFPAADKDSERLFMDITGRVVDESTLALELEGIGRKDTVIAEFDDKYSGAPAHTWDEGKGQRLALVGTVLRAKPHGNAPAGATASFVAVKRDFVAPRDVPGVGLLPSALEMLGSEYHRLHHTVWHTLRGDWPGLRDEVREQIGALGWYLDRPPLTANNALVLGNGAGEDFLFMHRRMIGMVRDKYAEADRPMIPGWQDLPAAYSPQFAYVEADDPENPGKKLYRYAPELSGFEVPVANDQDADSTKFLKTAAYFGSVMRPLSMMFRSPRFLASLTLGDLGNMIEFGIHNQMHMRWSQLPVDPATGSPAVRDPYDVDPAKWAVPTYDYLGDFYSSHVHPLFWRLHGWVDDRINDWFAAHEAAHPGQIERGELKGVDWFRPGPWVYVADPWDKMLDHAAMHHAGHHDDDEMAEIERMKRVMQLLQAAAEASPALRALRPTRRLTGFARFVEPFLAVGSIPA